MSKSALYAGLGQGLMALGKNVGEAYRMKAIEELRQENLQTNWAREDKIRAEDRSFQKELTADNRAHQAEQTKSDREWQIERDNQKIEQQKGLLQDTRTHENSKSAADIGYEEVDGKHFKVEKNASGKVVKRTELRTDPNELQPMMKLRVDSITDEINGITKSGMLGVDDKIDKRYELLIQQRNDILGLDSPAPNEGDAPQSAIQALEENPSLAPQFKAKYGYLPQGY